MKKPFEVEPYSEPRQKFYEKPKRKNKDRQQDGKRNN